MGVDKKDDIINEEPLSEDKINERDDKIHQAYLNYLELGEEQYFVELMELVDSMSKYHVAEKMKEMMNRYDYHYLEDLMQEARFEMWRDLKQAKKRGDDSRFTYGYLARTIYTRTASRLVKGEVYTDKRKANHNADSIEQMSEDGVEQEARGTGSPMKMIYNKEAAEFYSKFLDGYVRALMKTKESPEYCLAVAYTRLLPHIIGYGKDSVASSVKWARRKMEKHNIDYLSNESEEEIAENGYPFFEWGPYYVEQLDKIVEIKGKRFVLRDVVYIDAYNNDRDIEHMDRRAHNIIFKDAIESLCQDSRFVSLGREYLDKDERLYKLIGGVK